MIYLACLAWIGHQLDAPIWFFVLLVIQFFFNLIGSGEE